MIQLRSPVCRARSCSKCESQNRAQWLLFQMGKKRRTRRGQLGAMIRPSKRRGHASRVHAQWGFVEIELGVLVKQGKTTALIQLHRDKMPLVCRGLQTTTESWLQVLWIRVRIQHQTRILSTIATQWQLMTRPKHSVIYQLASTRTAAGYVGMDEHQVYTERCKEHLTNLRDHVFNTDKKYASMLRKGGPGSWFMVPYNGIYLLVTWCKYSHLSPMKSNFIPSILSRNKCTEASE